jgi:four helix bundle protein
MERPIHVFERLDVWRLAHELALAAYRITERFPSREAYGLTSQLRRAALAIPTNIAEGNARGSSRDSLRFYLIARASLAEVRSLLLFAKDLGLFEKTEYERLVSEYDRVGKMLHFLIVRVRSRKPWERS